MENHAQKDLPTKEHSFLVSPPELQNWHALLIFSFFRLGLSATFIILSQFLDEPSFLGKENFALFSWCAYAYLGASMLFLVGSIKQKPDYDIQVNIPIIFDIIALTLIMHLSGGLLTGLGLLLIIICAAHSLLATSLFAFFGASLATLAILGEQIVIQVTHGLTSYSQAGLLGLAIFFTVLVLLSLKKRMHHMQQLAYIRGLRLETSLKLNTQVVAFMQEGVIVFNHNHDIQLMNQAAKRLLAIKGATPPTHLQDLPIRFVQALHQWLENQQDDIFQIKKESAEVRLSGIKLSDDASDSDYVVFIHDISKDNQKAQHMKLALLGSLAANIAHEIRNPLSSASHAAQLLNESQHLSASELKLVSMIIDNCQRMNTVIKNVLNMSKKQSAKPKDLEVGDFMDKFIKSFKPSGFSELMLEYTPPKSPFYIHIDPTQLHQMLVNLCENGLRYSMRHIQQPKLEIRIEVNEDDQIIQLHIIDFGPGIDGRDVKHMFEPFYTTESHGSGLGLYISREICQMNGGDIRYQPGQEIGSDFYIQLPLIMEGRLYDSA